MSEYKLFFQCANAAGVAVLPALSQSGGAILRLAEATIKVKVRRVKKQCPPCNPPAGQVLRNIIHIWKPQHILLAR